MKITKCSCEESQHLRQALDAIDRICTEETGAYEDVDMAQIVCLIDQAKELEPLEGDQGLPGNWAWLRQKSDNDRRAAGGLPRLDLRVPTEDP